MQYPNEKPEKQVPDEVDLAELGEEKARTQGGWKALLAPVLIAVIVTFAMLQFWAMPQLVSKADFTTNFTALTNTISEIQRNQQALSDSLATKADMGQINNLSQQISSIQNQLSNMPTRADMERINVVISDIANLKSQINAISSSVSGLKDDIDGVTSDIADLKDDIDNLEEEKASGGSTADIKKDDIYAEVQGYDLSISSTDAQITTRLYFTNDSNTDITITKASLLIYASTFGSTVDITLTDFSSNIPFNWSITKLGKNIWYMTGGSYYGISGFKVEADDDRDGFVNVIFDTVGLPTSPVYLVVELDDFEYEVID